MENIINKVLDWVKSQSNIKGCISGSSLLEYFEGQDVDIFLYDEASFTKLLYAMYYNDMFTLIEPLEQWKFKEWTNGKRLGINKIGIVTIKMKYNLAVDVNIIYKKDANNIFSVLSSFDLDIISKGYDLQTMEYLDLSKKDGKTAHWNKWNPAFYSDNIWDISKLLRQFERCIKYHKRGYNTDNIVIKYQDMLHKLVEYESIFNSDKFDEKVKEMKKNAKIIDKIFNIWLSTHEIDDETFELLKVKIKLL